jgi:chemotaxis protein histidine kinase CheA
MKTQFLKHSILLVTSVACITFSFAQKNGRLKHSSSAHSNSNNYLNINDDSSVNPVQTRINYKNGQEMYNIEMSADKVTGLYVNNKKIPADSFYLYNGIIDKIKEQIKKDKAQAEEDRKQASLDMQQAEKDKTQATTDRAHAQEQRKQAEKDREQANKDQAQAETDRKQAEKNREQAKKYRQQALEDQAEAVEERKLAELDRKQAEEDRALIKNLIEELVKDDIIPDGKSVTQLMLTNEEFIINGKKQLEELHSKFKAKFLKKPGHSISYRSVSGYGIYLNQ